MGLSISVEVAENLTNYISDGESIVEGPNSRFKSDDKVYYENCRSRHISRGKIRVELANAIFDYLEIWNNRRR